LKRAWSAATNSCAGRLSIDVPDSVADPTTVITAYLSVQA
jgi:hypothetical protein